MQASDLFFYTGQEIFPRGLILFQKVYNVHNVVKDITGSQETKSCPNESNLSVERNVVH